MIATIDQVATTATRTNSFSERTTEGVRPAPLMIAVALGAVAITSIAVSPPAVPFLRPSTTTTSSTSWLNGIAADSRVTSDALVRRVRESANLTWEQLARVFGVSRRSVHNWAAGENMSAHNIELVARLNALVAGLSGSTPDEKRLGLFAADASGVSPVDAFRQMAARSGYDVNGPIASQEALFNV